MLLKIALVYLVLINVLGFAQMGLDKRRARKEKWRVPEARLFLVALLGGSLGSWLGMQVFHHKTKHITFVVGMPAILLMQIIVTAVLCSKFYYGN